MINVTDLCTVLARTSTPDFTTGGATYGETTLMTDQPCSFGVLSAADHDQLWGDGTTPTNTDVVTASLRLPSWSVQMTGADTYTVTVNGYAGTWRVLSKRPGAQWSTYLLAQN